MSITKAHYLPQFRPISFTADNKRIYWQWGKGTDFGQLVVHDFGHSNRNEILYNAQRAQIGGVIFHPIDRTVLSITEIYHKPDIYVANNTVLSDLQYLVNLKPTATPVIEGMSLGKNLTKNCPKTKSLNIYIFICFN